MTPTHATIDFVHERVQWQDMIFAICIDCNAEGRIYPDHPECPELCETCDGVGSMHVASEKVPNCPHGCGPDHSFILIDQYDTGPEIACDHCELPLVARESNHAATRSYFYEC